MIRIVALAAALLIPAPAWADEIVIIDSVPTAHVSYADLDLQSKSGRARLAKRIRAAAEDVCAGSATETSITEPLQNDCYVAAVSSGMRQLNAIAGL